MEGFNFIFWFRCGILVDHLRWLFIFRHLAAIWEPTDKLKDVSENPKNGFLWCWFWGSDVRWKHTTTQNRILACVSYSPRMSISKVFLRSD
jgi:hypothetical protein